MTVSELRQIGAERYELTFSDGTQIKTMLSVVADYALCSGRELDEDEYNAVLRDSSRAKCRDRAMRLIGLRPMSQRELYDKLIDKGEDEANAADTVAWLIGLHLLDDSDYAGMLVRHYSQKGYGARRVQDELYRHKVPKTLWEEALEQMPDQDGRIDALLRSRLKGDTPDRAALKRATDALLRRGFTWEEIRSAVSRYNSEIEEDI